MGTVPSLSPLLSPHRGSLLPERDTIKEDILHASSVPVWEKSSERKTEFQLNIYLSGKVRVKMASAVQPSLKSLNHLLIPIEAIGSISRAIEKARVG